MSGAAPDAGRPSSAEEWETHAAWWQEQFTDGVDPEYTEQILPLVVSWTEGFGRVVEVGAGEGQVSRAIAAGGASLVVAVDPTEAQVRAAHQRGGGPLAVRADAGILPLADASMDAAVVCLVLEHVDDLEGALGELARVVRAGGRFLLLLNHPLLQTPGSGWVDDHLLDPPEQYWQLGPYLDEAATYEEVEAGVHIRFLHRPLHVYVNSLVEVGFRIVHLAEPAPPAGFLARSPAYREAAAIPRLMALVLERVEPGRPGGVEHAGGAAQPVGQRGVSS
ncbi:MAG: class I SAM-dependent methyltransferase [Acidimicrobiia bacterium]|nr:class I SAM-dependent methyltransferase [Acidimicrobiia bacterium]